jgi:two-component system cell cycle sensor histidine kinase/response regulator CckA
LPQKTQSQNQKEIKRLREEVERLRHRLARAEERSRMYLDVAGVIVLFLDREGKVLQANPRACALLEGEEQEIIGRQWFDSFVPERERTKVQKIFQQLMERAVAAPEYAENRVVTLKGNFRWVAWHNRMIESPDGEILGTFSAGEDITERRKIEQALRESEERFRELTETLPQVVFETDTQGAITYANRRAFELFGYEDEDLRRGLNALETLAVEDQKRARENIRRVLRGDRPQSVEYTARRKDGSTFPVMVDSTLIVRDGKPVGLRGIIVDLTEHKAAEQALSKSEERLRQSQKMEAIGRLAGGIAHDFNNLLTTILGYSEMLLSGDSTTGQSREPIQEISKSAQRAASLTQQLLAYSRKQVLRPEELDINEMVENAVRMLRRLIHEHVQLSTDLDPGVGRVRADPAQLEQVVVNLAINARDSMPEGGKLTIETKEVMLDESYSRRRPEIVPGLYAMLAVTDTGVGMDQDTQRHIFEPFYTTKAPGKGTGLGLATVFGTVKQSNGYIYVYSEPGLGSTFKVYLPVVHTRKRPLHGRPAKNSARMPRGKILLVEDDELLRRMALRILEGSGCAVVAASDGERALGLLDNPVHGKIDLLVSDVIMPGIGGRDLAEKLKARFPELKVLYISGYPDETVVRHGVLSRGVAYLQKPFSPADLINRVREILAQD